MDPKATVEILLFYHFALLKDPIRFYQLKRKLHPAAVVSACHVYKQ